MRLALLFILLVVVASCTPSTPLTAPEPEVKTQETAQPVDQSLVPPPIAPKPLPPSDSTERPEVPVEPVSDESTSVAEQEAALDSGAYVLGTEGPEVITAVKCDLATSLLSFTLVNNLEKGYSLKVTSVFSLPDGVEQMRFSLNGRQLRTMPELCGAKDTLAIGDSVDCSIPFASNDLKERVMMRVGPDEWGKPLPNNLHFASSYDNAQVTFVCR